MDRYVCIHGHFYQPPRENPWLEAIELQDSAYPYHDWNQRITAECYAPNSASRILDPESRIQTIVNNYSKISFNFGPTLLSWLQAEAAEVYTAILAADRDSQQRFSGHGSAMAQAYNHIILPLANARDKRTQVMWGIEDFKRRFGREPEGMWLPETAVDVASLEAVAEMGLKFTVLSPYQAKRFRALGTRAWKDVSGGDIDPSRAYQIRLPSRRSLAVFFYDGPISRAVAFEDILTRGEDLAERLCGAFSDLRDWPQLAHIATDGETYGHHRRHADMALAYALQYVETNQRARLTNYGEFLEKHPPTHEAQVFDNSSWSCVHGVERWRSNCGCNSGSNGGWNQDWRAPLRNALDWLRDELARRLDASRGRLFRDPWKARDEYIHVVLDRSSESVDRFLERHAARPLKGPDRIKALMTMEIQRHAMLMYTSCGWFFDELSGIETVQVIQYAGRALQLAKDLFGEDLESGFLNLLEHAKSNIEEHRDGKTIFEKFVRPATVDLDKVAAHYAISSLFEDYGPKSRIYSFQADREGFGVSQQGKARLAVGRVHVKSLITEESKILNFGVVHLGDQNVSGGVRAHTGAEPYQQLVKETLDVFHRGDIPQLVRVLDRNFDGGIYSLHLLFKDEQRKIMNRILEQALGEAVVLFRNFHGQYSTLARFVAEIGMPLPKRFQMAVELALNQDLLSALSTPQTEPGTVEALLEQVRRTGIPLDNVTLEFTFRRTIERAAAELEGQPENLHLLDRMDRLGAICTILPFEVDLWTAQNVYHRLRESVGVAMRDRVSAEDPHAVTWAHTMHALGSKLGFAPELVPPEPGP